MTIYILYIAHQNGTLVLFYAIQFSDCYFVSSLIDALATMVTENTAPPTEGTQT